MAESFRARLQLLVDKKMHEPFAFSQKKSDFDLSCQLVDAWLEVITSCLDESKTSIRLNEQLFPTDEDASVESIDHWAKVVYKLPLSSREYRVILKCAVLELLDEHGEEIDFENITIFWMDGHIYAAFNEF